MLRTCSFLSVVIGCVGLLTLGTDGDLDVQAELLGLHALENQLSTSFVGNPLASGHSGAKVAFLAPQKYLLFHSSSFLPKGVDRPRQDARRDVDERAEQTYQEEPIGERGDDFNGLMQPTSQLSPHDSPHFLKQVSHLAYTIFRLAFFCRISAMR